ncbi:MAG: creatininase family protein [bacterium]|nr:creatininase family protein [bacterium]
MNTVNATSGPKILHWETLTKSQFDRLDRSRCCVLVTCSPLEVHGPHLPFGADALEGEGLAEQMLRHLPERHRDRIFLKIPYCYAASDPVPQPGSLSFRPSTTIAFLEDLGRSLAAQGFRDILVSNFHGSPRHFLSIETACDRVSRERDVRMVSVFSIVVGRLTTGNSDLDAVLGEIPGVNREDLMGDTHGGLVETSQLLALHPEWVDPAYKTLPRRTVEIWLGEKKAARSEPKSGKLSTVPTMLRSFKDTIRFFSVETYSGTPAAASPELGERFLGVLAENAAQAVSEIWDGTLPREQWHSPLWKLRFLFVHPWMVRLMNRLVGVPRTIS